MKRVLSTHESRGRSVVDGPIAPSSLLVSYELTVTLKGGAIEVEADTPAQLMKRVAALDLRRLEDAIRKARAGKPVAKGARGR